MGLEDEVIVYAAGPTDTVEPTVNTSPVKASAEITLIDVTDAYSVILTSEAYTFVGNPDGAPSESSCSTNVIAYRGAQQCTQVNVTAVACPTGISAIISDNNTASPMITFTTTEIISDSCEAIISIAVNDITFEKKFSFAVAKQGDTGIGEIEVGARNLIRNSTNLIFEDYYFIIDDSAKAITGIAVVGQAIVGKG